MANVHTLKEFSGLRLPILTANIPRQPVLSLFEKHSDIQALPVRLERQGKILRLTKRTFLQLCSTNRDDYLRPTLKHLEPAWVYDVETPIMHILGSDPVPEFPLFCRGESANHLGHISAQGFFRAIHLLLTEHGQSVQELEEPPADQDGEIDAPASERFAAELIGESKLMQRLRAVAERLSRSGAAALLSGPPGSGKMLLAMAIHRACAAPSSAYRTVYADKLDEAAIRQLQQLLREADGAGNDGGGTLIIKSIESLPASVQVDLLDYLQSGRDTAQAGWRILATSSKSWTELQELAAMDADLLHRLGGVRLELPPLERRRDDIPLLMQHFCRDFGNTLGRAIRVDRSALKVLQHETFADHVRGLETLVQRFAFESERDVLDRQALRALLGNGERKDAEQPLALSTNIVREAVARAEREAFSMVLASTRGNLSEAARFLKLDRAGLHRKLKRLGLRAG